MLLRLPHSSPTSTFTMIRLLPMSGGDKDAEILTLRQQAMVLKRQLGR